MKSKVEQKYCTSIEKVAFNVWISDKAKKYIKKHSNIKKHRLHPTEMLYICLAFSGDERFQSDIDVLVKLEQQGVDMIYFN